MHFWQECCIISSWYQRVNDVIYIITSEVCNNQLFKLVCVRFAYSKIVSSFVINRIFLVALTVKNLLAMKETWVWSLGWGDPLKKGMATHSSILTWRIPWTEKSGGLHTVHGIAESDVIEWLTHFVVNKDLEGVYKDFTNPVFSQTCLRFDGCRSVVTVFTLLFT